MPKKQTKILIIIIFLIDIISIGVFVFLFYFTKSLVIESTDKENDIKTELKKEDSRVLMKDDLAQGKMYNKELTNYMISSGGTVNFIKTIELLVSNSGLRFNIKTVSNELFSEGDAIGAELLRISMDVTGEWKNVKFFLESLENYPLKIDINKVSFNKFSDYVVKGKNIPQWSGSFDFTVVKIKDIE